MKERLKDETRSVFKKVDICPRCNNHLEIDVKESEIQCEKCGLIIHITSKFNRLRQWLVVATIYIGMLGVGCVLFVLT